MKLEKSTWKVGRATLRCRSSRTPADVQWADAVTLLGYDVQTSPEALTLTVIWQAKRRMTESYKVFVHVTDEASGAIVAQDDSIPRRWSYSTDWWEQNEVVKDTITIPTGSDPVRSLRRNNRCLSTPLPGSACRPARGRASVIRTTSCL